jgi:hypothetical protein
MEHDTFLQTLFGAIGIIIALLGTWFIWRFTRHKLPHSCQQHCQHLGPNTLLERERPSDHLLPTHRHVDSQYRQLMLSRRCLLLVEDIDDHFPTSEWRVCCSVVCTS